MRCSQVILAGSLAFDILDRLTGDWTVVKQDWAKKFFVDPLMIQVTHHATSPLTMIGKESLLTYVVVCSLVCGSWWRCSYGW